MAKDKTIQKQLDNFDKQRYVKFLKNRYQTKSMMEIVGVHRDENKHSDFLAWLFDSSSDHQLGAEPAKNLIELIKKNGQLLPIIADKITKCTAKREVAGKDRDRVDIILEIEVGNDKIRVVFENKVNAPETIDKDGIGQTKRYYQEYSQKNDGFKNVYIYNRCDKSQLPQCEEFICITYQDIVDNIIEPLFTNKINYIISKGRTEFILKDYILTLEKPVNVEKQTDKIIMAMGKELKENLQKFLDKNFDLFATAIETATVANNDLEKKQIYEELASVLKKYKNISSTHKVEIIAPENIKQHYTSLGKAAHAIIEVLAKQYDEDDTLQSPKSIKGFENYIHKKDFYGDNTLFAPNTEPLPSGSFPEYATIKIADITYHVRTDWYTDKRPTQSFQKFLNTLRNDNELLPNLQVTVCKDKTQIYPSQQ